MDDDVIWTGDEQGFSLIFERLRPWLSTKLPIDRRLRRVIDPDDVLQRTYIAAVNRLPEFEFRSLPGLRAWLLVIAKNVVRDLRDKYVNSKKRGGAVSQPHRPATAQHLADGPTPSVAASRAEDRDDVRRALSMLSPGDAQIIEARDFSRKTLREVADALGVSERSVTNRHAKALRRFKAALDRIRGDDEQPGR